MSADTGLGLNTLNRNIQAILYKKYQGFTNTSTDKALDAEYNINAAPNVFANKVFLENIPTVAPFGTTGFDTNSDVSSSSFDSNQGKKAVHKTNNKHIVYYSNIKLTSIGGSDFAFAYDAGFNQNAASDLADTDNILKDAIPSKFDPNGSYGISVKAANDNIIYTSNYTLDREAGVLTIYGLLDHPETPVSSSYPPKISFWRYEGRKGSSGFASDWAKYAATQDVDMCGYSIKGLKEVSGTSLTDLQRDLCGNSAASIDFVSKYVAKYVELSGGKLTGSLLDLSSITIAGVKYDAWDASGIYLNNIRSVKYTDICNNYNDVSQVAVNVEGMKSYISEYFTNSSQTDPVTINNLTGDNISYTTVCGTNIYATTICGDTIYSSTTICGDTFNDNRTAVVNVNTLLGYVPQAENRGNYLLWKDASDSSWTAMSGDRVLLGENVGDKNFASVGAGAVAIGAGAGANGIGANSIVIGKNASASTAIPEKSIVLNATGSSFSDAINNNALNSGNGDVMIFVKDLFKATTLNGGTKALYYDPSTNAIAAGDICGITMYRDDAGDASGWYRYPAQQAVNMQGTSPGVLHNYIFNLSDPSSAPFTYSSALDNTEVTLSGEAVYQTMATTVGWVKSHVTNYVAQEISNVTVEINNAIANVDLSKWATYSAVNDVDMSNNQIKRLEMPDWSANLIEEHKKYAVNKEYVDISDAGAAAGEENPISITKWMEKYVIAAPPAPVLDGSGATPQTMFLSFKNPTQIYVGAFDMRLPAMKKLWIDICGSSTKTAILSGSATYVPDASEVTQVVIGKSTSSVVKDSYSASTYYWKYLNANDDPTTAIKVRVWYTNGNPSPINRLEALIGPFAAAGAPSAPSNFSISASDVTPTLSWKAPAEYDDAANIPYSSGQTMYYRVALTPVATSRYTGLTGGNDSNIGLTLSAITDVSYNVTGTGGSESNVSFSGTNLYPDTSYNYTIITSTASDYSNPNTNLSGSFRTNKPAAPSTAFTGLSFVASDVFTGPYYATDATGTEINGIPLFQKSAGAKFTASGKLAIHTASNIGTTASNISTITAKIDGETQTNNIASIAASGFNNTLPTVTNATIIDLTAVQSDLYSSDVYRKGYYKVLELSGAIKSNTINSDTNLHSINILRDNSTANSLSFRIDDLSGPSSGSISIGSISTFKITGVPHVNQNASIPITWSTINFVDKYSRPTPITINLLDVNNTNINSANDKPYLTLVGLSISNKDINDTVHSATFKYGTSTFSDQLKAELTAINIRNETINPKPNFTYGSAMLDALNVENYNLYYGTDTLPNYTKNTDITGSLRKILNSQNDIFDYSSTASTKDSYDHAISLTGNLALHFCKGRFTTKVAEPASYYNYSFANYSTISQAGNRYMAFGWNGPSAASGLNGLKLKLHNVNTNGKTLTVNGDGNLFIDGIQVNIYYRFDGKLNGSTVQQSVWIKATQKNPNTFTIASITDSTNDKTIGGIAGSSTAFYTYSDGVLSYDNLCISGMADTKVYVLVEVPMTASFGFTRATLQFN